MNRKDAAEQVWKLRLEKIINHCDNQAILEKYYLSTSPEEQKDILRDIYDGQDQLAQERKLETIGITHGRLPDILQYIASILILKTAVSLLLDIAPKEY